MIFNVTVTKGASSLVFECESDGTYVSIAHLSHEPKDSVPPESAYTVSFYGGPGGTGDGVGGNNKIMS